MHPAARIRQVQAPIIAVVGEWIRETPGTLSLGQGVVHYGPPEAALARVRQGLDGQAAHRYAHVAGLVPLLDRIREKLAVENGLPVGSEQEVVVTAGGNMAFMHAVLAVTDPGDEVVLPVPYYFNHEMAVRIAGAEPVFVPTDDAYRLQAGAIAAAITPRTRAVVTVSPNNPTGTVYDEASLRAVSALCRARGLFHISDEAYEYFTYDGVPHVSPGAFEGAGAYTLSLFSLSKAYGMAGWRVGYMALPRALLPAVKKIQDTILICPPVPSQLAALGAMEAGAAYPGQHIGSLAEVRHLVLDALAQLGDRVTVPPAEGAFYLFARVHTDRDALTLVERLIREHRVAVIPGETFGTAGGCYLRIAYGALQHDTVAEAMERLVRGIRALIGG